MPKPPTVFERYVTGPHRPTDRRGFYVFEVDSESDEEYALVAMDGVGMRDVRVIEREYDEERIFITFQPDATTPGDIRERLMLKGVIC